MKTKFEAIKNEIELTIEAMEMLTRKDIICALAEGIGIGIILGFALIGIDSTIRG